MQPDEEMPRSPGRGSVEFVPVVRFGGLSIDGIGQVLRIQDSVLRLLPECVGVAFGITKPWGTDSWASASMAPATAGSAGESS